MIVLYECLLFCKFCKISCVLQNNTFVMQMLLVVNLSSNNFGPRQNTDTVVFCLVLLLTEFSAFVVQDAITYNLTIIRCSLALNRPIQEEVLGSNILDPDAIPGKICNLVLFFYFLSFYVHGYQFVFLSTRFC